MLITYDPNKSLKNFKGRNLPFELVREFDWSTAITEQDIRHLYPEARFVSFSYINERLHVISFTPIMNGIRVISFRKANKRKIRDYEKKLPLTDEEGEVRELTDEELEQFRPIEEVMSPEFMAMVRQHMQEHRVKSHRGKQKSPTKELVSIRLSAEVLQKFRAMGKGWQSKIDKVLLDYIHSSL